MQAVVLREHGGPEVLSFEAIDPPVPGPGEVRVRVRAVALNHLDLWVRRGIPIETTMPHVGGSDIAGIVEEIGPGVAGWKGGERVVVNPALSCGQCEFCIRGEESLCPHFRILGEHTDAARAEFS